MTRPFPAWIILALALPAALSAQFSTKLSPKTEQAFDAYRKAAEAKLNWQPHYPDIQAGEVQVGPARDDGSTDVKDGIVHDWVGATLVPGATVAEALAMLQDYSSYKDVYAPQVLDSKVLSRPGSNRWNVYLQMKKQKVLTVVLNGEFDITYHDLGAGRWNMVSRSTRIAEVDQDDNQELPLGTGRGFLWRLNAYWLIEPRPEGVYLECRSISLSRDVPFLLSVMLKGFVTSVPPESLRETMDDTVRALQMVVAARTRQEYPTIAQQEVGQ